MAQGRNLLIDVFHALALCYLSRDPISSTLEEFTVIFGALLIVCSATQYLSVHWISLSTLFCSASSTNPTGALLSNPLVPRKSRPPSALTSPLLSLIPNAGATAFNVTRAHPTSASSSISSEHSSPGMDASGPPAAGCKPATCYFAAETGGPEDKEQAIEVEERVPLDLRVSRAEDGSD